jgi:hypothetical protein
MELDTSSSGKGYEDWVHVVQNKIDDFVTFMGCWTEPVNHFTLAVYEKD